ncbi:hypothetical protein BH09BAC2_BH09BAC2_02070 [soil metagenome]
MHLVGNANAMGPKWGSGQVGSFGEVLSKLFLNNIMYNNAVNGFILEFLSFYWSAKLSIIWFEVSIPGCIVLIRFHFF